MNQAVAFVKSILIQIFSFGFLEKFSNHFSKSTPKNVKNEKISARIQIYQQISAMFDRNRTFPSDLVEIPRKTGLKYIQNRGRCLNYQILSNFKYTFFFIISYFFYVFFTLFSFFSTFFSAFLFGI